MYNRNRLKKLTAILLVSAMILTLPEISYGSEIIEVTETTGEEGDYDSIEEDAQETIIVEDSHIDMEEVSSLDGEFFEETILTGSDAMGRKEPKSPVYDKATGKVSYDYVYFGSYPQTEVTGENLTNNITGANYIESNDYTATVEDKKYRRLSKDMASYVPTTTGSIHFNWLQGGYNGYHYFQYEPIKWRVLENDGTNLLLLAETALDGNVYYDVHAGYTTWADSTIRNDLQENFLKRAFTNAEKAAICVSSIVNEKNPDYGSTGGIDTEDRVFLLSLSEVRNDQYGFINSNYRVAECTDYAKAMGVHDTSGSGYYACNWWLRSPGNSTRFAADVRYHGDVDSNGVYVDIAYMAVRPAIRIPLSSSLWSNISDDSEPSVPTTITGLDNIVIHAAGYGYTRIQALNADGAILKNTDITLDFPEGGAPFFGTTDENGYVTVKTPYLTNETQETKYMTLKAPLYAGKKGVLFYDCEHEVEIPVTIEPLSFKQKWEAVSKASIEAVLKKGVEFDIGFASLEASLAEIGMTGSLGGKLSVSNSYSAGKRTLELNETYTTSAALKAKGGLSSQASILNKPVKINVLSASGGVENGNNVSVGLKIENYDPSNVSQLFDVGKFLLGAVTNANGNLLLMEVVESLGWDYTNLRGVSNSMKCNGGVNGAGITAKDSNGENKGLGSMLSYRTARTITQSASTDETNQFTTYGYSYKTDDTAKIGEIKNRVNFSALSKDIGINTSIAVSVDQNGILQSTKVKWSESESNKLMFDSEKITENTEVAFGPEQTEMFRKANSYFNMYCMEFGKVLFDSARQDIYQMIAQPDHKGTYKDTTEETTITEIEIPFGAVFGAGLKAELDLAGSESLEYETERGIWENDEKRRISESQIEYQVKSKKLSLSEIVTEPIREIGAAVMGCLKDVGGKIEDGLKVAGAEIKEKYNSVKNWTVHIVSIMPGIKSTSFESYEISTYANEEDAVGGTPGITSTVGAPYIVYVTDEKNEEVTDYSEEPLTLSLSYEDEALIQAGASMEDAQSLAIYQYSEEDCAYIYRGGEVNTEKKTVDLVLTKPGQYVLAIDTVAPYISDITITDKSTTPTILVNMSELSGIAEFSMKIDETECINMENLYQYYDKAGGGLTYKVETPLTHGMHTLTIYAKDSAGNAMQAPLEYSFEVDAIPPKIKSARAAVKQQKLKIRADITGEDIGIVGASIQWKKTDGSFAETECVLEKTGAEHYEAEIACMDLVMAAKVTVKASDTVGNRSEKVVKVTFATHNPLRDKEEASREEGGAEKNGYVTVNLKKDSFVYTGEEIRPAISAKYTYTSYGNSNVRDGKVKTVKLVENRDYSLVYDRNVDVGQAEITLIGMGDYSGEYSLPFTITAKDMKKAIIEPISDRISADSSKDMTEQIQSEIIVTDGTLKVSRDDFDIVFTVNGTQVDSIKGSNQEQLITVSVKGKNNYHGDVKKAESFIIYPSDSTKTILDGNVTVELKQPQKKYFYTGKAIKPSVIVKDKSGVKLNKKCYKLVYLDNVHSGTARIKVIGRNDYLGNVEIPFVIEKKDLKKVKVKALSKLSFTDTADSICPVVKNGKSYLTVEKDYNIDVSQVQDVSLLGMKFKKVKLILNAIEDSDYTGNKEVACTIIPRSLNNLLCVKAYCEKEELTESSQMKPIVYYNDEKLIEGTDYQILSYKSNEKLNTVSIVIGGIGNYSGKRTIKVKVM